MGSISRRQFVGLTGVTIGLAASGAMLNTLEAEAVFLRPPGASADDTTFLARCSRCKKCLSVCETGVIQPLSISQSVRAHSTPILNFTYSYCNFCMKCVEVCPTQALAPLAPSLVPVVGIAQINRESCVAWAWDGCTECVTICPKQAISLDEKKRPVVMADLCDGCGLCEMKCPSAALRTFSEASKQKGITVVAREASAL